MQEPARNAGVQQLIDRLKADPELGRIPGLVRFLRVFAVEAVQDEELRTFLQRSGVVVLGVHLDITGPLSYENTSTAEEREAERNPKP